MPIISRFSRFVAQSCQFREAETNKQLAATTPGLHDLSEGC